MSDNKLLFVVPITLKASTWTKYIMMWTVVQREWQPMCLQWGVSGEIPKPQCSSTATYTSHYRKGEQLERRGQF